MKNWLEKVQELRACSEAIHWGKQFETLEQAWANCERGDWMLWLLGKLAGPPSEESGKRKKLVLAACQCARLALKYVPEGERRPLIAIETAEKWVHGEDDVTLNDVRKAAADAAYAAYAAYAAAAYAAYAAYAAADAARKSILKQCADIVREYYPEPPELE